MSAIAAMQEALLSRLSHSTIAWPAYRVPVSVMTEPPYITFDLYSPGVDDTSVCGGTAVRHLTFAIKVWFRDGNLPEEDTAITVAEAIQTRLEAWTGTQGSYTFVAIKAGEDEEKPFPTDPLPLMRAWVAYWRFEVMG